MPNVVKDEFIDKCAEKLEKISANVTAEDRKEAMKTLDVSYHTVLRYLKGGGRNLDLGLKLYELLNKRIEDRKLSLSGNTVKL